MLCNLETCLVPIRVVHPGRRTLEKVSSQRLDGCHERSRDLGALQAFCPALIVPGIGYSDDKLLQTRIFSYADTQRHRLGPNYLLLPANAPKSAHHNNHHEGFMNFMTRDEEVWSLPSMLLLLWSHLAFSIWDVCVMRQLSWSLRSAGISPAVCTKKCESIPEKLAAFGIRAHEDSYP